MPDGSTPGEPVRNLIDVGSRRNLTQERLDKLATIRFDDLPLDLAIKQVRGNGKRVIAMFSDPFCPFCRRLDQNLASMDNVTIYTFLYPILGPDSITKAQDVWCAKDPAKVWRDWMLKAVVPPKVTAKCDATALDRNTELGHKHRVQGTPAAVFEDGTRLPGAVPVDHVEKQLTLAAKKG